MLEELIRVLDSFDLGIAALEKALTLVSPDTSDYAKATNELNDLKNAPAPKEEPKQPETLTQPPTGEPIVVPPLTLPESSGPPATQQAEPATESPQPSF